MNSAPGVTFAARHSFTGGDGALDRFSAVIFQEQHHWNDVAVRIEQSRARLDVTRGLRELRLFARNVPPLQAALVPSRNRCLRDKRQRDDILNTFNVLHAPGETIDRRHQIEAHASGLRRLHDDREDVDPDGKLGRDDVGIDVVARARAQFRHARLRIPNGRLTPLPHAQRQQPDGQGDDDQRWPAIRHTGQTHPEPRKLRLPPVDSSAISVIESDERHEHGQQHEIRENHDGHAQTGRHGHLTNHLYRDQQNRDEPDEIRQQRDNRRRQQLTEACDALPACYRCRRMQLP